MARGSGRGWQGYPDSRLVVVSEEATVDIFTAGGRIYAARASGRLVVPSLEPRQGGLS